MKHIFIDESIHDKHNFILSAFVFFDDCPSELVDKAFETLGLCPANEEYKSSKRKKNEPIYQDLRSRLFDILQGSKIAVSILPATNRCLLGKFQLQTLERIISANDLQRDFYSVYIDQGIKFNDDDIMIFKKNTKNHISLMFNQDSKYIKGIQLADLASHSTSAMLKEFMQEPKIIRTLDEDGQLIEMALSFKFFKLLRHNFFCNYLSLSKEEFELALDIDPIEAMSVTVKDYGLFISDQCSEEVKNAALTCLSKLYMGCTI